MKKFGIAVDIGATNIRVALGDRKGTLIKKIKRKTAQKGNELTLANQIIDMILELINENNLKDIKGIGIGSIGPLDIKKGWIVNTPNLGIKNSNIVKPLRNFFNIPVYLLNDCVAAVWGEKHFGAGRKYKNIVYITISTGIGGGVIVDDHLLLGKDGNAHEVGHIVIDYKSKLRCGCGRIGHWEGYASGINIPNFIMYYLKKKKVKNIPWVKGLTSEEFFGLVKKGDKFAREVLKELSKIYAAGIASVINVYDPELLTLGGSVFLNNYELLFPPIKRYLRLYLLNRKPRIIKTPLGGDIVLYGGLALVFSPPPGLARIYSENYN